MSGLRAEILKVDFPDTAAARIIIQSPPEKIFNFLADARSHSLFDGSGTIKGAISAPERLFLGAKFGMAMKIKVPYRVTNTVVAFQENSKITWCHLMKWTWSYELRDLGNGSTEVTEIFDAHAIPRLAKKWLALTNSLERNPKVMAKSLVRLKQLCE